MFISSRTLIPIPPNTTKKENNRILHIHIMMGNLLSFFFIDVGYPILRRAPSPYYCNDSA